MTNNNGEDFEIGVRVRAYLSHGEVSGTVTALDGDSARVEWDDGEEGWDPIDSLEVVS